jgi:hypothetical protein
MWEDITVGKMSLVLAVFMLMIIVEKLKLISYYSQKQMLFTSFFSWDLTSGKTKKVKKKVKFSPLQALEALRVVRG